MFGVMTFYSLLRPESTLRSNYAGHLKTLRFAKFGKLTKRNLGVMFGSTRVITKQVKAKKKQECTSTECEKE